MDSLSIILASTTCLLCCVWLLRRTAVSPPTTLPPGPPGWPVVGNLVQVLLQNRQFIHIIHDLHHKYGPIFTMRMGQRTLVILTGSTIIHEALVQKGAVFANRPRASPLRQVFIGKCTMMNSAQYGPVWRNLRRNFVTELANTTRVQQNGWVRKWAIDEHLKDLEVKRVRNEAVEVMSVCRFTICRILICLCFGAKMSPEKFRSIQCILRDVMLIALPKLPDFLPVLRPFFRRDMAAAKELRRRQMECMVPLVRARRAFCDGSRKLSANHLEPDFFEMVSPVGAAYIDSLFNLEPAGPGQGRLGEEEVVTLISEVIIAGSDTTATTMEWAMLHLVMDQEIQEKLYLEIVGKVGVDGVVTDKDAEEMVYLDAVIKETFRRHPPAQFLVPHAAARPMELGGYVIPTNVNVEIYTAWLAMDPEVWEAPEEFRPERFLDGGEGMEVDITGSRGVKMAPFGVGRRICPAWGLGTLHLKLLVARMVHAFKWVPVLGHPPDPTEQSVLTVVVKNPLKAIVLPRQKT